jgi:hypothetical protein
MRYAHVFPLLAVAVLIGSSQAIGQSLIAGTGGTPPTTQTSFAGLLPGLEVASSFQVIAGQSPFAISELQIVAFHYPTTAGTSAKFTLYEDTASGPGAVVATFLADNITTTEQSLALVPVQPAVVLPETRYWLAGLTLSEQVNWVHGNNAFSQTASRSRGAWMVPPGSNGNAVAFALFGTALPEPGSIMLTGLSLITGLARWRSR